MRLGKLSEPTLEDRRGQVAYPAFGDLRDHGREDLDVVQPGGLKTRNLVEHIDDRSRRMAGACAVPQRDPSGALGSLGGSGFRSRGRCWWRPGWGCLGVWQRVSARPTPARMRAKPRSWPGG